LVTCSVSGAVCGRTAAADPAKLRWSGKTTGEQQDGTTHMSSRYTKRTLTKECTGNPAARARRRGG
ncbi:hypothetical protein KUCAC02_032184, partial [Chaenocephalus aceratus]